MNRARISPQEASKKLQASTALKDWKLIDNALERALIFEDFKKAFAFMTQVADEAEAMNHHPDWMNVYNKIRIRLNTHDVGGISELDFALAEKIEALWNQRTA